MTQQEFKETIEKLLIPYWYMANLSHSFIKGLSSSFQQMDKRHIHVYQHNDPELKPENILSEEKIHQMIDNLSEYAILSKYDETRDCDFDILNLQQIFEHRNMYIKAENKQDKLPLNIEEDREMIIEWIDTLELVAQRISKYCSKHLRFHIDSLFCPLYLERNVNRDDFVGISLAEMKITIFMLTKLIDEDFMHELDQIRCRVMKLIEVISVQQVQLRTIQHKLLCDNALDSKRQDTFLKDLKEIFRDQRLVTMCQDALKTENPFVQYLLETFITKGYNVRDYYGYQLFDICNYVDQLMYEEDRSGALLQHAGGYYFDYPSFDSNLEQMIRVLKCIMIHFSRLSHYQHAVLDENAEDNIYLNDVVNFYIHEVRNNTEDLEDEEKEYIDK